MTRVLAVLLLICPAALARAEPIEAGDRAAIRAVIENQIAAFRRDDAEAAFGYAAPSIQAMFGTPENFIRMVREDYQAVYRPREVEFRELEMRRGIPTQRVLVVGPDGTPKLALYPMQRQPDGAWRIAGCTLVPAPDESV